MKNIPRSALILLSIALVSLIANLCLLRNVDDGERVVAPNAQSQFDFTYDQTSENTYYLCTAKDDVTSQPPEENLSNLSLMLNSEEKPIDASVIRTNEAIKNVTLSVSPKRQLTLPETFQTKYSLEKKDYECAETENVTINPGTLSLSLPEDTLVINASSPVNHLRSITALFFLFLVSLFGGIGILCKKVIPALPTIPFYDAPLAFIIALTIAVGFQLGMDYLLPPDNMLLPGFGSMLTAVAANCLGFFIAVGIFFFIHRKAEPQQEPQKDQLISVPVVAAFLLAVTGIFDVLFSPVPVLEPVEMAQNLISFRFVHVHFAVLAGIYEELLFRGIIQTALMPGPNSKHPMLANVNAVAITTILFVLLHVPQSLEHAWALVPIGLVSIVSGILRIRSGSIFQSILLHMSYNTLLLLASFLRPSSLI